MGGEEGNQVLQQDGVLLVLPVVVDEQRVLERQDHQFLAPHRADQRGEVRLPQQTGDRLGVLTELLDGARERLPPLRIPLLAPHLDTPVGALGVGDVAGPVGEDREVDLEALTAPVDLEVRDHGPVIGGVVPKMAQHHALGVVDRFADLDDARHEFPGPRPFGPVRTAVDMRRAAMCQCHFSTERRHTLLG